jgi:hypothetical protein
MPTHRPRRNVQFSCDYFVGFTVGEELRDLRFPPAQGGLFLE